MSYVSDSNIDKSGFQLETRWQGKSLGSVAVVKASPSHKSKYLGARRVQADKQANLVGKTDSL